MADIFVLRIGQSNAANMSVNIAPGPTASPVAAVRRWTGVGYTPPAGQGDIFLGNAIAALHPGDNIRMIQAAEGGTPLLASMASRFWLDPADIAGNLFFDAKEMVFAASDFLGVGARAVHYAFWSQGEEESGIQKTAGGFVTREEYRDALVDFVNNLLRPNIGNLSTESKLPFIIMPTGRNTSSTSPNSQWNDIRLGQIDAAALLDVCEYSPTTIPLGLSDTVHYDGPGQESLGTWAAITLENIQGTSTFARGPTFIPVIGTSLTTTDLDVTHTGGTDFTPIDPSQITQFEMTSDGTYTDITVTSALRIDATTIRLIHTAASAKTRFVRYLSGKSPTVTGAVFDNLSPRPMPLEWESNIQATGGMMTKPTFSNPELNPTWPHYTAVQAAIPLMEGVPGQTQVPQVLKHPSQSDVWTSSLAFSDSDGWEWVAGTDAPPDLALTYHNTAGNKLFQLTTAGTGIDTSSGSGTVLMVKYQAAPTDNFDADWGAGTGGTSPIEARRRGSPGDLFGINGGTSQATGADFSFSTPASTRTMAWTWTIGSSGLIYKNGTDVTNTVNNMTAGGALDEITLFQKAPGAADNITGELQTFIVLDVELTAGQVETWAAAPWGIYQQAGAAVNPPTLDTPLTDINSTLYDTINNNQTGNFSGAVSYRVVFDYDVNFTPDGISVNNGVITGDIDVTQQERAIHVELIGTNAAGSVSGFFTWFIPNILP